MTPPLTDGALMPSHRVLAFGTRMSHATRALSAAPSQLTVTVTPSEANALPGQTVLGTIQITSSTDATIDSVNVVASGA